ncbi:MAG: DUF6789 family protein [Gemmatimonadales bacterium]
MKPNTGKAILGGLIGTIAITMMMYWVGPLMGFMKMDIAQGLGDFLGIGWTAGLIMHFVNGTIIFPLIYALALYQVLPGSPVVKGLTWGAILWLIAQVVVMPMMGAGVFSANMGGAVTASGSLLGHLVYGALLGGIAGRPTAIGAAQPRRAAA